jgi:hypothetical protein
LTISCHVYKAKAKSPAATTTPATDPESVLPALVVAVAGALLVALAPVPAPAEPVALAVLPAPPATDVAEPVAIALDVAVFGSTAAWYRLQVGIGADGQSSAMQMAWSSGSVVAGIATGGAHFRPKVLERAMPTAVTSAVATPKDAAERPT